VHYSDDQDDLVGPRRGRAPQPNGGADAGDEDLVGPRRGSASRSDAPDAADAEELVGPRRGARRSILDDDDDVDAPRAAAPRPRPGGRGRTGERGPSRETLMSLVRDVPSFIKLFGRLATDPRVSKLDKAIVAAVLVYLVSPVDLVPDWVIPVVGQIEDVYLLALALSRLVNNAGVDVLMDHWEGDVASLESALSVLDRAGSVLPGPIQALLGSRR
jgi:uncharacterized membrane protein YkvA (DUF1232 family)